jgi:hypothetical protein
MSLLDGEIRNGRHHMEIRVYYEDTDFSDPVLSLHGTPCSFSISSGVRVLGKSSTPIMADNRA